MKNPKHPIVRFLECVGIIPLLLLCLAGCALIPEVRVFQKKVPPPVEQFQVTEGQRQVADVIARNPEVPLMLKPVATGLSASLGAPKKPLIFKTPLMEAEEALKVLRVENVSLRAIVEKQQAWMRANAGKELEGTGWNLTGPLGFLGVAGVVALFVFVPGALTAALFVIRRLRTTIQKMSQGVEEFEVDNPETASVLKDNYLSSAMDTAHKKIVAREKKYIDKTNIEKALKKKNAASASAQPK